MTELPLRKLTFYNTTTKKTRRGWILGLHDALGKIWFFNGGKWPWIKVSDELLTDKKNQWKKWQWGEKQEKNYLEMNQQYGALQQIL